jgi:hypothetical protein
MEGAQEVGRPNMHVNVEVPELVGGLYTPRYIPYGMGGFHPHSMEFHGLFFGWQPSNFFIPYPLWNPYECPWNGSFHMESIWNIPGSVKTSHQLRDLHVDVHVRAWIPWTGPCGFHGISDEFGIYQLQFHVLFHGTVHGTVHMDSMEQFI